MATPFDQNMSIGGQSYGNMSASTTSLVESWKKLKHPWVSLAHVICRISPILFYVFSNLLEAGFIIQMVTFLILITIDFWVVKNISGRLLVGLRWWAQTDDEGKTKWVYEQAENMAIYDPIEGKIFWGVLFLAPFIWGFFVIVDFFTFKWVWMILAGMGFVMTSINAYGYIKCRWNTTSEITNYFSKMALLSLLRRGTQQPPAPQKPTETV
uniref:Golgi apparatus membrane protein TVP23 homolog n=1 Tax=Strongyloides papillosus TaxID=174720 RepID=A0A0N5B4P1_STREA